MNILAVFMHVDMVDGDGFYAGVEVATELILTSMIGMKPRL